MRLARALLIGLLLAPVNAYWVIQMERVHAGPYVTSISLFANVVFCLAILVAANWGLKRVWPRAALGAGELMLIYTILCVASAMAGMDYLQVLVMILGHARQFATPENQWESFFPHIPKWLLVFDAEAVGRFHGGHANFFEPENYRPYLVPCLAWLTVVAGLLVATQATDMLLARPWIERERLTFPVLEMPLALVRERPAYFRQPVFLAGMIIPILWGGLNGLHVLYPAVPELKVRAFDLVQGSPLRMLRAMRWMPVTFYPFAIGLGYLLPTDLLFSSWFFYFFWKLEVGLMALLAWDVNPKMPYPEQQAYGACIALVGYLAYTSRGYLHEVAEALRGRGPQVARAREFKQSLVALAAGAGYLVCFSRLTGMSPLAIVLFWTAYAVIVVAVTRMRAELGPPVHDFHRTGPELMIVPSVGSQSFTARDLVMFNLYWWFNRSYRNLPMAHQIEGLKAAHETGVRPGWFHAGVFLGGIVGAAAALVSYLYLGFKLGAAGGFHSGFGYGWANFGQIMNWLSRPTMPDHAATGAIATGLAFSLFLLAMRLRFLDWPFHPIGFAIASGWSINLVWLPMLIAWVAKVSIIRWGGRRGYVRLRPFFLGLILGECLMGSFWAVIGVLFEIPVYSFWGA